MRADSGIEAVRLHIPLYIDERKLLTKLPPDAEVEGVRPSGGPASSFFSLPRP